MSSRTRRSSCFSPSATPGLSGTASHNLVTETKPTPPPGTSFHPPRKTCYNTQNQAPPPPLPKGKLLPSQTQPTTHAPCVNIYSCDGRLAGGKGGEEPRRGDSVLSAERGGHLIETALCNRMTLRLVTHRVTPLRTRFFLTPPHTTYFFPYKGQLQRQRHLDKSALRWLVETPPAHLLSLCFSCVVHLPFAWLASPIARSVVTHMKNACYYGTKTTCFFSSSYYSA